MGISISIIREIAGDERLRICSWFGENLVRIQFEGNKCYKSSRWTVLCAAALALFYSNVKFYEEICH